MESYFFNNKFLSEHKLDELKNLIGFDSINHNYEKSHFYDNKNNTLVIDQHIRSSEKIQFKDDKLFDWFEVNVINQLNILYPHLYFVLFRDDIEMIRYKVNDFFKRHVDTINFYSNEFINYTCLINLKSCISGGETVLYDDENVANEFKDIGQHEGSILLFQKQLQHEGKTVLDGEKIIMVSNIVVFKKEQNNDVLIVTIEKTGNTYVIPIKYLHNFKETIYYTYYNFQKKINIQQNIFRYIESTINNNEFLEFYNLVFPKNTFSNLEAFDYIGLNKSDIYNDFNLLLNSNDNNLNYDSDEPTLVERIRYSNNDFGNKILLCHMDDYYHLLKLVDNENIIPFQLITFENNTKPDDWYYSGKKNSTVVWFGVYDNLFVTCDYNFHRIPSILHKYVKFSDDKSDANFVELPNRELQEKAKLLNINNAKQFDIYGGYDKKYDVNNLNQIIFDNNKFKKMNEITFSKSNDPYIAINKYVTKIMKDIESIDVGGEEFKGVASFIIGQKKLDPLYKLNNYEKVCDSKIKEFNVESLNNLDLIDLMNRIKNINFMSDIKKSNTSKELTCNSVQHTIYDVVFKFGFIHRKFIKVKPQK